MFEETDAPDAFKYVNFIENRIFLGIFRQQKGEWGWGEARGFIS